MCLMDDKPSLVQVMSSYRPDRWQAITWIHDDQVFFQRIYEYLSLYVLKTDTDFKKLLMVIQPLYQCKIDSSTRFLA